MEPVLRPPAELQGLLELRQGHRTTLQGKIRAATEPAANLKMTPTANPPPKPTADTTTTTKQPTTTTTIQGRLRPTMTSRPQQTLQLRSTSTMATDTILTLRALHRPLAPTPIAA